MVSWPADKIERRGVAGLAPYARNARTHSAEQVAQIAASIGEWGFTNPVLIDEGGGIIAGHGRVLAALKLGLEEIPCVVAVGWSDLQKQAYVIADNKLAPNAGWDDLMLIDELFEIAGLGFEFGLTGFSPRNLLALHRANYDPPGLTDDNAVPAIVGAFVLQVKPFAPRGGDVFILRDQRLKPIGSEQGNRVWDLT